MTGKTLLIIWAIGFGVALLFYWGAMSKKAPRPPYKRHKEKNDD